MNPISSALLGLAFVAVGLANTYLMYYLWGFPFDKATRKSDAPKPLMLAHRLLGFAFAAMYAVMLLWMVPRLWNYQVEFAPRTVVHIVLGMSVGFLLVLKISIMRFFRHLEEWMPFLGTGIALGAVVLVGLSAPFAFRERAFAARVEGGDAFAAENRSRVASLLPDAGFPQEALALDLSAEASLREGRRVLLDECVRCHDLKTVLARPRSPAEWLRTVVRMAEKPALFDPISQPESWSAAAYLIAITPGLQRSAKQIREDAEASNADRLLAVLKEAAAPLEDPAPAEARFKKVCSGCHTPVAVEDTPPSTPEAVNELITRMVRNGHACAEEDLRLVRALLLHKYVHGE